MSASMDMWVCSFIVTSSSNLTRMEQIGNLRDRRESNTAGVCERSEWSDGPSDIEGKTTVGVSKCGQRTSFNRTRVAGHLDEIQGVVANTLKLHRNRAVGFIHWLGLELSLHLRPLEKQDCGDS